MSDEKIVAAAEYNEEDPQLTIERLKTQLTIAREQLFELRKPDISTTVWNDVSLDPAAALPVAVIDGYGRLAKAININGKWYEQDYEDNLILIRQPITHWAELPK